MWQRKYGETSSPAFSSACTTIQAGSWRNRVQYNTPNLASKNFVFGTCAQQCSAVLGKIPDEEVVAPIGLSRGALRDALEGAREAGLGATESNVITAHELMQRQPMPLGLKESETDALDQAPEDGDFEVMHASTDGALEEIAYSTRGVVGNNAPFVRRFEQKVKEQRSKKFKVCAIGHYSSLCAGRVPNEARMPLSPRSFRTGWRARSSSPSSKLRPFATSFESGRSAERPRGVRNGWH